VRVRVRRGATACAGVSAAAAAVRVRVCAVKSSGSGNMFNVRRKVPCAEVSRRCVSNACAQAPACLSVCASIVDAIHRPRSLPLSSRQPTNHNHIPACSAPPTMPNMRTSRPRKAPWQIAATRNKSADGIKARAWRVRITVARRPVARRVCMIYVDVARDKSGLRRYMSPECQQRSSLYMRGARRSSEMPGNVHKQCGSGERSTEGPRVC